MTVAGTAQALTTLRLAVFHTGFSRDGPGLLLRDIRAGEPDILAARDAIIALRPDVILLLDIDYDRDGLALAAFSALLAEAGHALPHHLAPRPNTGMATGLDLDGDGQTGTADDAQGWGRFAGAGGMALLSRLPVMPGSFIDHSSVLWRDLPAARIPLVDGQPFPSPEVFAIQRLSTTGHWEVALQTPSGPLTLLAWHAGPPAFGGPHGRNRARNADETAFWLHRLSGARAPPPGHFVLLGNANLDPEGGDGDPAVIRALLADPRLQDPAPTAIPPGDSRPSRITGRWTNPTRALRVDYLLPAAGLQVVDGGLLWPSETARHAIVWADIAF